MKSQPLLVFLLFLLLTLHLIVAAPPTLSDCLTSANISFVLPSSVNYTLASQTFNARPVFHPAAIAYPTTASQVSPAVSCAAAVGLRVVPRSGGHGYEGYAAGGQDGSFVVDLAALDSVVVDNATETATVGAGVRAGKLYLEVAKSGYAVALGTCPDVGIGGLALGGGQGYYSRLWGLATDMVVGMKVVVANGTEVEASESANADLFWALKGAGGGNFGIVTEFKFLLKKAPAVVTSFFYTWSFANAVAVMTAFQAWGAAAGTGPEGGLALTVEKDGVEIMGAYQGPQDAFTQWVQPLLARLPAPTSTKIQQTDFITSVLLLSGLDTTSTDVNILALPSSQRDNFKAKSLLIPQSAPLPDAAYTLLAQKLGAPPSGVTEAWLEIDLWGGPGSAINAVPSDATAFVHRSALLGFQFLVGTDNPAISVSAEALVWVKDITDSLGVYLSAGVEAYQNYVDADLVGWDRAYYGANYAKLQVVKTRYDPTDVFSVPQGIVAAANGTTLTTAATATGAGASETMSVKAVPNSGLGTYNTMGRIAGGGGWVGALVGAVAVAVGV